MQTIVCEDLLQILLVYLDDIIEYSDSIADHLRRLERVFKKLREHGFKIEATKCEFFQRREVPWSCGVIRGHGNQPSEARGSDTMAYLKTLKDLRSFLGFASYY